jgi:TonB family protein
MKKTLILFVFLIIKTSIMVAQVSIGEDPIGLPMPLVYDNNKVDTPAKYQEASTYLDAMKIMKYPAVAKENNIQGKVVLQLLIGEDGRVLSQKVLSDTNELLNREAIRVVQNLPPFKPAIHQGKNVRVYFNFPLNFSLK